MSRTTVFDLSAVDRIESDVLALQMAIASLAKTLADLIAALGGGDQAAIDTATTALRELETNLRNDLSSRQAP